MSKPFNSAIITTAGAALLGRVEAGQASMEVTKIVIGDGAYSASERTIEALQARTALKSERNTYSPSTVSVVSEDTIKITALFSNYDAVGQTVLVSRGYFVNELAVYCKENGGAASTEVLYCIAVTSGSTGDYMPPYVGGGASQIIQDVYLTVGNAATAYVDLAGAAFLATEGQALKSEVASIKTRAESNTSAITALDTRVNGLIGSATPTPVATAAQMTDTSIIYVYTGSETGYTPGDWYYYDSSSSSWKSGGEYGAALIDSTLSQKGQAADAKVTGDGIETTSLLVNDLNGSINYGYDEYADIPASGTNYRGIAVKRFKEHVVLNGSSTDKVAIRLTGSFLRMAYSATTIKNWSDGIELKAGHLYAVIVKLVSGEYTANNNVAAVPCSVYRVGESDTVTTNNLFGADKKSVICYFTAEEGVKYNLCLYINNAYEYVFNNAHYLVTLKDLTEEKKKDLKERSLLNLVDYAVTVGIDTTSSFGLSVTRDDDRIILNGGSTYSGAAEKIKLNGILRVSHVTATVTGWNDGALELEPGQEYEVILTYLSGTASVHPSISVYRIGGYASVGTGERIGANYIRRFIAEEDVLYNIIGYVPIDSNYENAVYDITFRKIVADNDVKNYYIEELADTVNKTRENITEPSLVFLVATDIHRYSNNAGGVQNFKSMISNMAAFAKTVKTDFILNMGDLTDGDQTKEITIDRGQICTEEFMSIGIPYFFVVGNHDINPYAGGSTRPYTLSLEEMYQAYCFAHKGITFNKNENGTDYYIDFDWIDVRFIVLNASNGARYTYGESSADWLATALDTTKTVFFVVHQTPITTQIYDNVSTGNRDGIISALQSFVDNDGNLIQLSGHSHLDLAFIDPWVSIMQICQRFKPGLDGTPADTSETKITGYIDVQGNPQREAMTASEDAWSVCVYKPVSNDLDMIRFGAGADRYFHVTPISPTTLNTKLTETVTWSTSDSNVATVSDGVVTGVGTGKCAILAKDEAGNYECWIVENES